MLNVPPNQEATLSVALWKYHGLRERRRIYGFTGELVKNGKKERKKMEGRRPLDEKDAIQMSVSLRESGMGEFDLAPVVELLLARLSVAEDRDGNRGGQCVRWPCRHPS